MSTTTWDGVDRRQRTTALFEGKDRRSTFRGFLQDFTKTEHPIGFLMCQALGHPNALEEVPPSQRSRQDRDLGRLRFRCPRCKAPNGRTSY